MPIYEYRRPDGSTFEIQQSFSDPPLKKDPETGVEVVRVLHAPAVHFKGKGFYNTDYGTRKRQRETAAAGEGSSASAKEGGSDAAASTDGKGEGEAKKAKEEKKSKDTSSTTTKPESKPVAAAK